MEMSQNATVSSTNPKVSSINPTALLFGELHNLKLFRLSKHMQDQDFHLKKTTTFAWCTCSSLLLLHGWPVAQPNGNTPLPHFRNATYPPPPPPQNLHNLCFSFLLGITTVPRETENNTYANFFLKGVRGGANKVHYGKCGSVESERTLGTGFAYMLILRWKKGKWRMDHPEWIAWTFNPLLKVFYC